MHITIVSQSYPPSIWNSIGRTTYSIAQGLSALGHSVMVCTYNPTAGCKFAKDKNVRIQYIGVDSSGTLQIEAIEPWQQKTADFIKEYCSNTDVFICIDSYSYNAIKLSGVKAKMIGICNFLYSSIGWLQNIGEENEKKLLGDEKEFLLQCDVVLVNNEVTKQKIFNLIQRQAETYTIGIPEIKGYKHTPNKKQVLYVGKLNREKGIERVIRVMPQLEWMNLVICDQNSSATYRNIINKLIADLDIQPERVKCIDFLPTQDVWKLYTESEICVVPHFAEPFGYAAIYPMMLGTPTVVSTAHSLPEIVGDDSAGAVFRNLEELSFYLDEIHHMKMLQDTYAENGRKRVLANNSLTKMIASINAWL